MSWYDNNEAIVLLVQSNDSDATQLDIPAFDSLKSKFEDQNIAFFMINPMGRNNRDAVREELDGYGIDLA